MSKKYKILAVLVAVLIAIFISIINTDNTFAATYTTDIVGQAEQFKNDNEKFGGFRVKITQNKDSKTYPNFKVGEYVYGICVDEDTEEQYNLVYPIKNQIEMEVQNSNKAFHYAHHFGKVQDALAVGNISEAKTWLNTMKFCYANKFDHSNNMLALGKIQDKPNTQGTITGTTHDPNKIEVKEVSQGNYRVGPFVLNVIDAAISLNTGDVKVVLDGTTKDALLTDANGNNISKLNMGRNTVYVQLSHSSFVNKGKVQIKVGKEKYKAWITNWTKALGQQVQTIRTEIVKENVWFDMEWNYTTPLKLSLVKTDKAGNIINPIFNINVQQNGVSFSGYPKNVIGNNALPAIEPKNNSDITVTLTEISAPTGYGKLSGDIVVVLKYNASGTYWQATSSGGTISGQKYTVSSSTNSNTGVTITMEDPSLIEKITINKQNSQITSTKVNGAKFTIKFENVKSIQNYPNATFSNNTTTLTNVTTNSSGQFSFTDIEIANLSNPVKITIEETSAPTGYKQIKGKIYVTITRNGGNYTATTSKDNTVLDSEFMSGTITATNHEFTLNIKDVPIIRLGGIVWIDEETYKNDKETNPANGYIDDTYYAQNVRVRLYDKNGNQVLQDLYGSSLQDVRTNQNGKYIFENIEVATGYYVVFEYDGVNYEVKKWNDSKAGETPLERSEFNSNFTTIKGNGYIGASDVTIGSSNKYTDLQYIHQDSTKVQTSVLKTTEPITTKSGSILELGEVIQKYKMYAKSGAYISSTSSWMNTWDGGSTSEWLKSKAKSTNTYLDINAGLMKREVDLSVVKDVASATVSVNNNTTTYKYNEMIKDADGNYKILAELGETNSNTKEKYNLYLYSSDYNFRINDYVANGIANNVNSLSQAQIDQIKSASKELEVSVTYKILLNNQSSYGNVKVDKLVDYYDVNYNYIDLKHVKMSGGKETDLPKPTVEQAGTIEIDSKQYKKMNITLNNNEYIGAAGQQAIYVTLKVNKTQGMPITLGIYDNIAEIQSYTTKDGLVDIDSAPGNAVVKSNNKNVSRVEDDTDKARGLNITKVTKERTASGIVWEDNKTVTESTGYKHGDGTYNGEKSVNDVIVQLIEVKDIGGVQYEYIWQETRSGSESVKSLVNNGTDVKDYTYGNNNEIPDGQYKFTSFMPGNYILRFIYGDGTTQDVKTYNGQDYKSAIVSSDYNYKTLNYKDTSVRKNDAIDNEARRLQVMAESIVVDKKLGLELRDKTNLSKTWMCAETSRMSVPIEYEANDVTGGKIYGFDIKNVDFGLEKRPETKLELEKHLTALKVSTNESGPILDTASNRDDGLIKIIPAEGSNRAFKGSWVFETDIEELIKGATLEAQYTYTVKNVGEIDYLTSALINKYKEGSATYRKLLVGESGTEGISKEVKEALKSQTHTPGKYLGTTYYTGKVTGVEVVPSRAEELQEAVNNQLLFDVNKQNNADSEFEKANTNNNGAAVDRTVYDTEGKANNTYKINTVVKTKTPTNYIEPITGKNTSSKKLILTRTLTGNADELTYDSYIAEIMLYSNAAGRRDMEAVPGNLSYVHSDDSRRGLTEGEIDGVKWEGNERDECWAETITIRKPTGGIETKDTMIMIIVTAISSIVVVGAGIILIKKFVLKKQ